MQGPTSLGFRLPATWVLLGVPVHLREVLGGGCGYTTSLPWLLDEIEPRPVFEKKPLAWEEDMELYSRFLERKVRPGRRQPGGAHTALPPLPRINPTVTDLSPAWLQCTL